MPHPPWPIGSDVAPATCHRALSEDGHGDDEEGTAVSSADATRWQMVVPAGLSLSLPLTFQPDTPGPCNFNLPLHLQVCGQTLHRKQKWLCLVPSPFSPRMAQRSSPSSR